jgi:D-threo-aldose 1-dehydrogenase
MEKPLNKRQLGRSSIYVSELGFGGASIGNLYEACTNTEAEATIRKSWDLGMRYFDTSPSYGNGLSERRLGLALHQYPREDYIISTKVGDFLYAVPDRLPPDTIFVDQSPFHLRYDYSYDGIMRVFEDSLQRLGLNHIDILLVHDLDPIIHEQKTMAQHFRTYLESGYKALDELRSQGRIKAIGFGVKKWEVCAEALKYGDYECFMLERNYTLLEQPAFASFFPLCIKKKISILLAGPFASGVLGSGPVKGAYFHHKKADQRTLDRVKQIQRICHAYSVPIQAAAIQFPLRHPAIASVVVGTHSTQRIQENIDFLHYKIPQALWDALKQEAIIPKTSP